MSGYPHGNPHFPQQPNAIYPQIYNPSSAPPPGQPGQPMMPGYPYQPGFAVYPGQGVGQQGMPPSAMSYPNIAPTAPAYGYPGFPNVTPQQPWSAVEWVPATPQTAHTLTNRAVVAGYEGHDHSPLWVIRARFQGDVLPGKLAIKHNVAYVPWNGKENLVQNFEVCCGENIRWIESRDGNVPPNAIASGNTAAGEPLYVGRAREQGSLTPGKVHPSHKTLYISFGGIEIGHKAYEIMCTA